MTHAVNMCPVNFKKFSQINNLTQNLDASLLYSKLKFHQLNSKIKQNGKTWIIRSRAQIADWFQYSTKKVDRLIKHLESIGLLEKKVSMCYGTKKLFLSVDKSIDSVPINTKLLSILLELSGSLHAALIFSKIIFATTNTKIVHEQKKWCCLKKNDLSNWSGLSIRTIDSVMRHLATKGLILEKKFLWKNRLHTHYHIPNFVIQTVRDKFEIQTLPKTTPSQSLTSQHCSSEQIKTHDMSNKTENTPLLIKTNKKVIHTQNCRYTPEKKGLFIKVRTNLKKTNNNTPEKKNNFSPNKQCHYF